MDTRSNLLLPPANDSLEQGLVEKGRPSPFQNLYSRPLLGPITIWLAWPQLLARTSGQWVINPIKFRKAVRRHRQSVEVCPSPSLEENCRFQKGARKRADGGGDSRIAGTAPFAFGKKDNSCKGAPKAQVQINGSIVSVSRKAPKSSSHQQPHTCESFCEALEWPPAASASQEPARALGHWGWGRLLQASSRSLTSLVFQALVCRT